MDIQGLGYIGVRAKSLEDWTSFGTKFLGMQLTDRSAKSLALRMDDRKQRVVVSEDGGEGVGFYGWEVADAATLQDLGARLEKAAVQVARGSPSETILRRGVKPGETVVTDGHLRLVPGSRVSLKADATKKADGTKTDATKKETTKTDARKVEP